VVGGVKVDRNAAVVEPPSNPRVIRVGVSQDERRDVIQRATVRRERRLDLVPIAGEARVYKRHPPAVLDQIEVHALAAEPMNPGYDLGHRG
jgi:hypothetical protein